MTTSGVVVTDLDGTVVFSGTPGPSTVTVQTYAPGRGALITPAARDGWTRLSASSRLVVATTRTREQFERLALPGRPRWALVSNGRRLIVRGQEDPTWRDDVDARLALTAADRRDVTPLIGEFVASSPQVRSAVSDEAFFTLVVDRDHQEVLEDLRAWAEPALPALGWRYAVVGRKAYVLPEALDKGPLVARLLERVDVAGYAAAADSELDQTLVEAASTAMVPRGSWLAQRGATSLARTRASGVGAGTEVVQFLEDFLDPRP